MAVLIASSLRKEFSGDPLFDGVSFTVGRSDRLALAGPNGAGKTTLLRAIVGETSLQGGELAFAKGTRVALHDQRPPRERGLTLREYALSGAADLVAIEDGAARARAGDGRREPTTRRRYAATPRRRPGSSTPAAGTGATAPPPSLRGLGFRDADLDRPLDTFSGGELTRASLARALAGDPDLLLLDEPTNHLDVQSLEWLERELAVARRRRDPRRARPLVPRGGDDRRARAGGRAEPLFFAGPWHEWRREKAARAPRLRRRRRSGSRTTSSGSSASWSGSATRSRRRSRRRRS